MLLGLARGLLRELAFRGSGIATSYFYKFVRDPLFLAYLIPGGRATDLGGVSVSSTLTVLCIYCGEGSCRVLLSRVADEDCETYGRISFLSVQDFGSKRAISFDVWEVGFATATCCNTLEAGAGLGGVFCGKGGTASTGIGRHDAWYSSSMC